MKAAISPKDEGRVITALPSSQFCLHLLIALLKYHPPAFDFDTLSLIKKSFLWSSDSRKLAPAVLTTAHTPLPSSTQVSFLDKAPGLNDFFESVPLTPP